MADLPSACDHNGYLAMSDTFGTQAALFDFVEQWAEDARRGAVPPLSAYLARFPGHEDAIAREYLRLTGDVADPSSSRPPRLGNASLSELVERLSTPRRGSDRYSPGAELARGGMGAVVRVRDEDLRRDVAMKVMIVRGPRRVARFLEEAQITGQLQHPGVVPVHDLGVDGDGRVFFTMRLVEGRDLNEIIRLARAGAEGWSLPRVLEVLLKVCDTVAYAHARGVVHRDLKPSNVRVGEFGEVYVMDWGLAIVLRHEEHARPLENPRSSSMSSTSESSDPRGIANASSRVEDSPLDTREGDVLGTPSYMSPEQAQGRMREVGPAADVYAVGAMLYQILSGSAPYVASGESPSSDLVLDRVREGPPRRLRDLGSDAPDELVAICGRAMQRDPRDRYPSLREMAEDLRAYLEGRVVRAHRTGAWVELAKWISRNRALASSLFGAVLLAVGLVAVVAVLGARGRRHLQLLADARAPADLSARAKEIVPSGPEQIELLERWLAEARDLLSRRDAYVRELDELRSRALPSDPDDPRERAARREREERISYDYRLMAFYRGELERMKKDGGLSSEMMSTAEVEERLKSFQENLAILVAEPLSRRAWTFDDPEARLRFDTLESLVPALGVFLDSGAQDGSLRRMQARLELARTVEKRTLVDERATWEAAIASIGDRSESPHYHGLLIRPQLGLVPLRRDPRTQLWEFWHVQSGEAPVLGADGNWQLTPETGIVLVLIPDADFKLGAQHESESAPNFDPWAQPSESTPLLGQLSPVPCHLEPYLIAKYELTQSQWKRLAGRNPSSFTPASAGDSVHSLLHPVESVSWTDAMQVMSEFGLTLPTEAQWEFAARGGTTTPWWTGEDRQSLIGAANLADASAANSIWIDGNETADWPELDDGFVLHAPVGSFRPNAFGLHDVCGNVAEWCRDRGPVSYASWKDVRFGTFERPRPDEGLRVYRGGSFARRASAMRSAARAFAGPEHSSAEIGLRPARELER
jgi:serine/threonine protein kinase/formylglycine-generating enzyme required for sulfatase activity